MSIEVLVKEHSDELIADLLKWGTGKAPIEVRFDHDGNDQWAVITMYDYKGDNELSLRLHLNDLYDVHIGYYDKNDDFIELIQPLTPEQKAGLPEKLKKVLKKVLDDESGIRLPGSFLA